MSNGPKVVPLPETYLAEIAAELESLEGEELDRFLVEIGMDPNQLLEQSAAARDTAHREFGKLRFREARARVRARTAEKPAAILTFDIARKRAVLEAIRARGEQTGEMTIAARNQKLESESDLDTVLEACLKLGVIDEQGELKN